MRAAYAARLVLAATLSANYGIYGPTFELMESTPREPGSEEYLDSEKYQLRHWIARPSGQPALPDRAHEPHPPRQRRPAIGRLAALLHDRQRGAHRYLKSDATSDNVIIVVVNLDPHHVQSGWVELDLRALGLDDSTPYQVHDLLSDQRYQWRGRAIT